MSKSNCHFECRCCHVVFSVFWKESDSFDEIQFCPFCGQFISKEDLDAEEDVLHQSQLYCMIGN